MYYLSSFWGQFGPNATTFLLASELFPTHLRGRGHGISAAVGKLGALAADVVLGHVRPAGLWPQVLACMRRVTPNPFLTGGRKGEQAQVCNLGLLGLARGRRHGCMHSTQVCERKRALQWQADVGDGWRRRQRHKKSGRRLGMTATLRAVS